MTPNRIGALTSTIGTALLALSLLLLVGCSPGHKPGIRVHRIMDPTDPSGFDQALLGYYARDSLQNGRMFVNVMPGDSLIDCQVVLAGYTLWSGMPGSDKRVQYTNAVAVFHLHVSPLGIVTSKLDSVRLYDYKRERSWPDSLGTPVAWVDGYYSPEDSFYVGQAFDSSLGYYAPVYERRPGFRIMAHLSAPKFSPTTTAENLMRISDYHKAQEKEHDVELLLASTREEKRASLRPAGYRH